MKIIMSTPRFGKLSLPKRGLFLRFYVNMALEFYMILSYT